MCVHRRTFLLDFIAPPRIRVKQGHRGGQSYQKMRRTAAQAPLFQRWFSARCRLQCIYCIIQCIHFVSDSRPDTLRYNTYCIHCISTRYSGYGLYQPWDQIQWIRIAHVGSEHVLVERSNGGGPYMGDTYPLYLVQGLIQTVSTVSARDTVDTVCIVSQRIWTGV